MGVVGVATLLPRGMRACYPFRSTDGQCAAVGGKGYANHIVHCLLVLPNRQWLGEKISYLFDAFHPRNLKLSLPHPVANPMKAHVDGLGVLRFDVVVGEAHSEGVVHEDGGAGEGLRVT